jgi:hypothetical protein
MDGFMCTLYTWEGIDYIASKGSFHSIHAKWATAWLRAKFGPSMGLPTGYTAVFEGLHPDLRIVVDYHNRKELVLLAIIDNETGEEFDPRNMMMSAAGRGIETPHLINTGLAEVHARTMKEDAGSGDEGFVHMVYEGQTALPLEVEVHRIPAAASHGHRRVTQTHLGSSGGKPNARIGRVPQAIDSVVHGLRTEMDEGSDLGVQ